jgi:hypothetical protein
MDSIKKNLLKMEFFHLKYEKFVSKQDTFIKDKFISSIIKGDSYIQTAERNHFHERQYVNHFSLLIFTLPGLKSLTSAYTANPLAYKENLSKEDKNNLSEFIENVESAVSIIKNIKDTKINLLSEPDIKRYLFRYVNGFHDDGLRDIKFENEIKIGEKTGIFFAICDDRYLPDRVVTHVVDNTLQIANSTLYMAMFERLGIHLPCTHVVNQIWQFADTSYKVDLKERIKIFGQHRQFDKDIEKVHKELDDCYNEIDNEDNLLCRTHFNIMILDEDENLVQKCSEQIKGIFNNLNFKYYIPSYESLYNIFIGSVIGRESNLDKDYLFLSDLHSSLCLNINYTNFKDDDEGTLFADRIFQVPLRKDLWDAKKKRIAARNGIIVASTGGGKSVTALNIIQQDIEAGVKTIVVEFGKSFYQITKLYPDKSLHVDYDGQSPLGINPFRCDGKPDNEKIKTLVNLILKFWRMPMIASDTKQVVSLTKIVQQYYNDVLSNHSFPDFYNYVIKKGDSIYKQLEIEHEYFDLTSFKHICSEFIPGGFYENVCAYSPLEEQLAEKDFIVFELTKIKKDPFLVSVIMTILYDTIENKILSDRSVRGKLIFDEYAESQAIKDLASGTDIHSTVAFFYQKLRKENGAIITVIQTPSQLPDNEYTKGMIANTQILYVLPATEVVYDDVITAFKIKNESQINLMKSIKNDFSNKRPYSEIYMRFGDTYATVVRLELSREKFLAFQTDGEDWQAIQNLYEKTGSMETAIGEYKSLKKNKMKKLLFSLLIIAGCTMQTTYAQFVVSDPTLTAATKSNWLESLEKTGQQITELKGQTDLLTQSIEIYTKVSQTIKNTVTIKKIIERNINIIQIAANQMSLNSQDIVDTDTYKNHIKRVSNIISSSEQITDLLITIISDGTKMTDGERLTFLINLDEKTVVLESKMKKELRKFVKLQNDIQYIRALKMK